MEIIFAIAILVFSVVIHEVAHGYMALWLGDPTAKYEGRLTMNPIKHIDPFGSIILPLILAILPGNFVLGWAKPVPYNPYNLKNARWGEALVAIAGPASNIILAVFFGLLIRFADVLNLGQDFVMLALMTVTTNLVLALFNLVPIPPLDGSKILFSILPEKAVSIRSFFERIGFIPLLIFVIFFSQLLVPIIYFFINLITGISF